MYGAMAPMCWYSRGRTGRQEQSRPQASSAKLSRRYSVRSCEVDAKRKKVGRVGICLH